MSNASGKNPATHSEPCRPISVYDNLNSAIPPPATGCQRKDNRNHSVHDLPFSSISFKFDCDESENLKNNNLNDSQKAHTHQTYDNSIPSKKNGQKFHVDSTYAAVSNGKSSQQDTSQYSDSTESEPQNTVIDKPVISDAKSKFFGLKNNSMDSSESTKLIDINGKDGSRLQPKYQNIPNNSAVHRNNLDQLDSSVLGSATTNNKQSDGNESNSNRSTICFPPEAEISVNHHPSQVITTGECNKVVYMSTTVPQNIKGSNIAGRHTPTRNSLRHSRMLVVNKNYQGVKPPNPLGLKHPQIARFLLILLIIFGVTITFLGVWILLWAPNTRTQDNPYWSGLILTLAGIFGLVVIRFRRIKRQKLRENCFTFLKVDSIVLIMLAGVLCLIALTCAAIHLNNLLADTTKCTSTNILIANAACICIFGVTNANNTTVAALTEIIDEGFVPGTNEFQYRDLSCGEVTGAWKYILLVSTILNSLGLFVSILYLTMLFTKRNNKKEYSTVRSADVF